MRRLLVVTLSVGWAAPAGLAAGPDFNREVRPILAARCFKCHGPDDAARKADLRLDTRAGATAAAVVPGDPAKSELVRRIASADPGEVMPPPHVKNPLTDREKATLRAWVAAGANYDPHWAFVAPKRPAVPPAGAWARNPIDNLVLARLTAEWLKPSPEADRYTLARRAALDLTGLPPSPAEVDAFVTDDSPDAYEKYVDRLLASPHYGERWARRWLDLARYADTNGYEKDRPRSVWPYRDWVIRALNDDVPFDRFSVAQLAGDLLPNATTADRVATGFHRNTMLNEEGGIDPLEFRYYAVVDRANVTGTVWLGLTLGCAQCHTHKFDPIAHTEYFRFLAFLNNADEPELEVPTADEERHRAATREKVAALEAGLPDKLPKEQRDKLFEAWLAAERPKAVAWTPLRPAALDAGPDTKLTVLDGNSVLAAGDPHKQDRYTLAFADPPPGVTAIRLEALPHDSLPNRGPGRAYYEGPKGDFLLGEFTLTADGQRVAIGGASESHRSAPNTTAAKALDGQTQTGWAGRRDGQPSHAVFTLAKPLTAKAATLELVFERHYAASLGHFRIAVTTDARPIVARVTVNRQWQAVFGRGLVRTADDFGYQGEPPTHPELLDWLATEFVRPTWRAADRQAPGEPWSMKALHRLIVTSATYRQSSRVTPELRAKDAENKLLARGPRVRLEAELVRDSLLTSGGLLSRKLGGPSVFPPQPASVTTEGTYGSVSWKPSEGEDRYRRGLYAFAKRTAPFAMFGTFDGPSGEACVARREVSNTPLQALTMLNDTVVTDCARALGRKLAAAPGTTAERAALLFRLCLVRPPTADELALLVKFFDARRAAFAADPKQAATVAGPGEGNAADRAAWAATARAVLNLDEFVTKE